MAHDVFTIAGSNGVSIEFEIQRGGVASEDSSRYEHASTATAAHPGGGASRLTWNEFDDRLQVVSVAVDPALRGQGVGAKLYALLAEEALSKGKPLASDTSVSSEALKLYAALAAQGYDVRYAPNDDVVISRDAFDDPDSTSRAQGSLQFMSRGPVARVAGRLSPGQNPQPAPLYIQALLAPPKPAIPDLPAPTMAPAYGAPPPPPLAVDPEAFWRVELQGQILTRGLDELKAMALDGSLGAEVVAKPFKGGMWQQASKHPDLAAIIGHANAPVWHLAQPDGSRSGPHSPKELRDMAAQGSLSERSMAWRSGQAQWQPVGADGSDTLALLESGRQAASLPPPPEPNFHDKLAQRRAGHAPAQPRPTAFAPS